MALLAVKLKRIPRLQGNAVLEQNLHRCAYSKPAVWYSACQAICLHNVGALHNELDFKAHLVLEMSSVGSHSRMPAGPIPGDIASHTSIAYSQQSLAGMAGSRDSLY